MQALWTQAREKLKVLTIICANNTYAILKVRTTYQGLVSPRKLLAWDGPTSRLRVAVQA